VTIAKSFAVSKYELTFADWDACVEGGGCNGYKPKDQGWGRGRQPVLNVDWDDARQYVAWLFVVTGKTYRLLSEAEYEYAARAGTQTTYPWGDNIDLNGTAMTNCGECGTKWDNQTALVGSFAPNRFGLYDMVGNVFDWVEDCEHDTYDGAPTDGSAWIESGNCDARIIRGTSYGLTVKVLRSAARTWLPRGSRGSIVGFRVARTLETP
jgi:formylglycine-generating enzyme required for sulfatase activity